MNDDHEKHVEANIKMEAEKEVPKGAKAHIAEHARYLQRRKRQLPKKLIILSVEWDIVYHNNSYEVDLNKQQKYWGQTDFETNKISVFKGGKKKEAIWNTLFHEILHIIFDQLDIDSILGSREENVTVALSSALNDFFWRNFRQ